MGLFLVSYDLIDGKDYNRIITELDRLSAVRTQFSTYFLDVTVDGTEVLLQHLRQFVDGDDRLMVLKITDKPRYTRAFSGSNEWVAARFP